MAALLETRGLHAYYGETKVLHGIDFAVEQGGVTALLGANGAGKTTTLRAICGMMRRRARSTSTATASTPRRPRTSSRRGVAHVPDGRGTFLELTVEENLRSAPITRKDRAGVRRRSPAHVRLFPAA